MFIYGVLGQIYNFRKIMFNITFEDLSLRISRRIDIMLLSTFVLQDVCNFKISKFDVLWKCLQIENYFRGELRVYYNFIQY